MDERDHFRESFNYYKNRKKEKDLSNVIDFESENLPELVIHHRTTGKKEVGGNCMSCVELGLKPHEEWHTYSLKGFSGFMFIKNPFTPKSQQNWIRKCLEVYARKPSVTNLDHQHKYIDDTSLQADGDPVKRQLLEKLSWATLGYHYDWSTKNYSRANYSDFPECLADLVKHIVFCLNFKSFEPQAGILNYYSSKSRLGIHNDHSEDYLEEPLISISFGQTALFLMGTTVRTEKPVPMFLRSGDIVILSGACRISYHAVPLIIQEAVYNRYHVSDNDNVWDPFQQYIKEHRVNISVRQVYQNGMTEPK